MAVTIFYCETLGLYGKFTPRPNNNGATPMTDPHVATLRKQQQERRIAHTQRATPARVRTTGMVRLVLVPPEPIKR